MASRHNQDIPGLSRRLNRIITNCGRAAFKAKLADLKERFGIEVAQINPAYTSQECEPCGFVDKRNRKSQSEFRCLHCGHTAHADVQGAKVIAKRGSLGLDFRGMALTTNVRAAYYMLSVTSGEAAAQRPDCRGCAAGPDGTVWKR